ncbi:MAG TPA: RpiB/LacA/LacB family sugar-phosphate isomerase [Acetobacteraceae bacterium]|jgi:ribose 5-phosphate isomerase B
MRVVIGSDHAGFPLKQTLADHPRGRGHAVTDVGSFDPNPVDFPDIARALTACVLRGDAERGIMVCGTGVDAAIAADKVKGIRAAVLHDRHCAHHAVEHDDANVMCLGAQIVGAWLAYDLIDTYPRVKRRGQAWRRGFRAIRSSAAASRN